MKNKKLKLLVFIIFEIIFGVLGIYLAGLFYQFFLKTIESDYKTIEYSINTTIKLFQDIKFRQLYLLLLFIITSINVYLITYESNRKILKTGMIQVTDKIAIPMPAGNGQYGLAHFMTMDDLKKIKELSTFKYEGKKNIPSKGGLVIGIQAIGEFPQNKKIEKIEFISADRHSVIVGSTRSGKSRRMILQSIWLTILAGENILVTDPKGELYAYTQPFAEKNNYSIMTLDFRDPDKSSHYNYMQEILDAIEKDNIADAIDYTWDLVSIMVGEQKGEPIWHNGECATIAASILIVAMEAPPEYRNLTNVYYFLAFMAQPNEFGEMPFNDFLAKLPDDHPAKGVFAMAGIAHQKTRGSFFSSALGTLKHFTNPKIAEMTTMTDINFGETVNKKTIIYIIIPDEKNTLYSLGSIFIMQLYIYLAKAAIFHGGRCPIDWNFFLDEFGQLPLIPTMPQFLSVGAGRGIRLTLVLQAFQQLKKVYKDDYETILNNCEAWIYLKCSVKDTKKEFSERLGTYTVQSNSTSVSMSKHNFTDNNYTNSSNLISRPLLMEDEIGEIESPHALISFSGKSPIMLIAPDLSYYRANQELGLGDEEQNKDIYIKRHSLRKKRTIQKLQLWGIWKEYIETSVTEEDIEENQQERISFLDF